VTEPDMRSSAEAVAYAKELHKIVTWIGICDGNMQEGSFRCDANVSVRKPGASLGTRREIKNLNSFKFMQQAMDYEIRWQIEQLEDGHAIQQATVLFDPDTGETRSMRTKEDAADYRYFPDPDLPPLVIGRDWVEKTRSEMAELPRAMAVRFVNDYCLSEADGNLLTTEKHTAEFFDAAMREVLNEEGSTGVRHAQGVANWLNGDIAARMKKSGISDIRKIPLTAWHVVTLVRRIADGTISGKIAKDKVIPAIWDGRLTSALAVDDVIKRERLKQMSDSGELEKIIDYVLAANAKNVEEIKAGNSKAMNALVGQAMKATQGKANPAQVNALLKQKIG